MLYKCSCSVEHKRIYFEEWRKARSSRTLLITVWLQVIVQMSLSVFTRTTKCIPIWNISRVNKWSQNFHLRWIVPLTCNTSNSHSNTNREIHTSHETRFKDYKGLHYSLKPRQSKRHFNAASPHKPVHKATTYIMCHYKMGIKTE